MSTSPSPTFSSLPADEELAFAGLRRQAELLAEGSVTSAQLVALSLARIEASQPQLNAFRCVRDEAARAEAEAADARLAAGERLPLLGVPVAIKDDMDIAGETTPFGCAGEFEPKWQDSEVTRRLRAAGAIVVGKTNTCELGQWPFSESRAFGAARNPWNRDHTPGGSSGGSAAAVAAGLVAAAAGSDGAGSVRIPAAWTHLVGIKPQRGRISTWPDAEAFKGLTCIGPLARTVDDAALLLDVLSGSHPGDLHRPPAPPEPFADAARRTPRRLRIALSLRIPFSGAPARLDPAVRAPVERLAQRLAELGHDVVEDDPRYGLIGATLLARAGGGLAEWGERVPDVRLLDSRTQKNIQTGKLLSGPVLSAARAWEGPLRRRVGRIFERCDVVLAPTTAQPALPIGAAEGLGPWGTDKLIVAACPYAWTWNVLGWPGVNVPAGFAAEGMPVGAQLLGPAHSEALLLSVARELEQAERWQERRPPLAAAVA